MTTLMTTRPSGTREFRVPFRGPLPGATTQGDGELVLETRGPAGTASALRLRFFPSEIEFQVQMPRLLKASGLETSVVELGNLGMASRPVFVYQARPGVLTRVPAGIRTLEDLEAYLVTRPAIFNVADYQFSGFEFDDIR